jgi:hypothetical protein
MDNFEEVAERLEDFLESLIGKEIEEISLDSGVFTVYLSDDSMFELSTDEEFTFYYEYPPAAH